MKLQVIQEKIYTIRNQRVMLDNDLAELYEVETKKLNQAVKRNISRFPIEFMFQLTWEEYHSLRSQFVTLENEGRGRYSKFQPFAFTEHGVAMLASVLRSEKAINMNIAIIKAFIALRQFAMNYQELVLQIKELQQITKGHDQKFDDVIEVLNQLVKTKREQKEWNDREPIGFKK
jgi:phage regulator Rha-like protein